DTGRYNCGSATILYNALAAEVGLQAFGGETTAHVASLVAARDGLLRVETTCPRWIEPRGSSLFKSDGQVARSEAGGHRTLDVPQLVALVYYNVGVDLAEQRRYAGAVAANYKALRLDPAGASARVNLLAA